MILIPRPRKRAEALPKPTHGTEDVTSKPEAAKRAAQTQTLDLRRKRLSTWELCVSGRGCDWLNHNGVLAPEAST
jgi:hypothetical protein